MIELMCVGIEFWCGLLCLLLVYIVGEYGDEECGSCLVDVVLFFWQSEQFCGEGDFGGF